MDALITKEQAAELLGVSVSRVRQMRDAGELNVLKNKRTKRIRFYREQVMALRRERDQWEAQSREKQPA